MLVYFAHPIDQAHAPMRQINSIRGLLVEMEVSYYRPAGGFNLQRPDVVELLQTDRINRFALTTADALLAWLPSGVATLGVPAEIEEALRWGKPTVILTDNNLMTNSVQIAGWRARGASVVEWQEDRRDDEYVASFLKLLKTEPQGGELPFHVELHDNPPFEVNLHPAAKAPSRAYDDDAGLDLAILEETRLAPGEYKLIPTGVRGAIPSGWWGMITGRSSTWAKYRCDVRQAVIDAGYRGELMIGVENRGDSAQVFEAGTRLAQYVLIPTFPGGVHVTPQLPPAHRGEAGYGSSGA